MQLVNSHTVVRKDHQLDLNHLVVSVQERVCLGCFTYQMWLIKEQLTKPTKLVIKQQIVFIEALNKPDFFI